MRHERYTTATSFDMHACVYVLVMHMHQVHTTYEDGVHAVLFSSVPDLDVKPEWVERARARTQSVSGRQGRALG